MSKDRAALLERIIKDHIPGAPAGVGIVIDRQLSKAYREDPMIWCEPIIQIMKNKLREAVILREYMLVKQLQGAFAEQIKKPALELYLHDQRFHGNVDSIVHGIMKIIEDHVYPVGAGDLTININVDHPDQKHLEEELQKILYAAGFKYNGKHVTDEFSRIAYKYDDNISLDSKEDSNVK